MNTKNIYAVFKKELRGYINNPTTYIIAGVFLALWEFLFFQNVFLIGETSLQGLFNILPWFFLLLVPAITMGSIAEETNKGTLEILLTHSLRDKELILGKYLSALAFLATLLLASLPIAISLGSFGHLDVGVYVGQYIASVFLASTLVGLGVGVSTFFKNQVPSLMVSVVGAFLLIIIGFDLVTMSLPGWLGTLFSRLSVLPHFSSLARGVLDLRDIWYFVLLTALFLQIGHMRLVARRTSKSSGKVMHERAIAIGLAVVLLFTSGFGFFPNIRIDLTEGNIYTLTKATKKILADLPEDVEIILYESPNLPAQYQPISRTVKDVLRDYNTYGGSRLSVLYKDPDTDQNIAQEAQDAGVFPVQFNTVGNGEFQVRQAYFGLVVKAGDKTKSIPLIQKTSDLEYQLTSFVNELTRVSKKKIAFLDVPGAKTQNSGYSQLSQELRKQFDIENVSLSEATSTIPDDVDALVVTGSSGMFDTSVAEALKDYISKGKNVLFMIDTISVNPQYLFVTENATSTEDLLSEYGVTVNQDLVYDLRSNQTVQVGGGRVTYFMPYPAFVQAGVAEGVLAGSSIINVTVPWGSSISVDDSVLSSQGFKSTPLVFTTKYGGAEKETFMIDPQKSFPETNLGQKVLGVLLKSAQDKGDNDKNNSRIVVMGDSDLFSDSFLQGSAGNIAFGMEILSYLAQEDSLAGIKIKQETSHPLVFQNANQIAWVKYGNMLGILLLLSLSGAVIIGKRRKLRKLTYKEGKNR